ncbi:MAG: glycosyltransferase family 4 protein [Candidatus Bathyarchaeota archaeon]|nr:MAG: glycosyltransferase family 4 protein [Candidatus Bathyarchaeota archaeon]
MTSRFPSSKLGVQPLGHSTRKMCYVTANPSLARTRRLIGTIRQLVAPRLVTVWPLRYSPLGFNIESAVKLSSLSIKGLRNTDLVIMEITAMMPFPYLFKTMILDYSTPLSAEVFYLHRDEWFRRIMERSEKSLVKHARIVIVSNQMMAERCKQLGARRIVHLPNFPNKSFQPTIDRDTWRKDHTVPLESKVALFTAGWRLKEIYGLDLLLESWRIIEKCVENSYLVIVGPRPQGEMSIAELTMEISRFQLKRVILAGWQGEASLANWIHSADVCLAPRTPGFPSKWYNDQDSTKISEYAALSKPIVATGYSPSHQYLLVRQNHEAFSEGILKAFEDKVGHAKPHFWEENEEKILRGITSALPD